MKIFFSCLVASYAYLVLMGLGMAVTLKDVCRKILSWTKTKYLSCEIAMSPRLNIYVHTCMFSFAFKIQRLFANNVNTQRNYNQNYIIIISFLYSILIISEIVYTNQISIDFSQSTTTKRMLRDRTKPNHMRGIHFVWILE